MSSLLEGKRIIVLGAGGSIGSAVAKQFAADGAKVFLAGRTASSVDLVAEAINKAGGTAQSAQLDALDVGAVDGYVDRVVGSEGRLDAIFNAMGPLVTEYSNGENAVDLSVDRFMVPLSTVVRSNFISARAAARQMIKQKFGAIIFLTGSPARGHTQGATAIGSAFGAIETFAENLAVELGPFGVRSVCLRTTTNVDSRTVKMIIEGKMAHSDATRDQMIAGLAGMNFLRRPLTTSDTAHMASFLASDRARFVTGTVVNSTAGAAPD